MSETQSTSSTPSSDLRDALAESLQQSLRALVEGTQEDLRRFALSISDDLSLALARNDQDLASEIADQAQLLAEINRLRAVNEAWDTVHGVIRGVIGVAIAAVGAA